MRQAGRYQSEYRTIREKVDFLTLCKTPQLAAEVTVMAVEQLKVDAAIIFADILLPIEPLGAGLRFSKGDGPVIEKPVTSQADLLSLRDFNAGEELSYVASAIELFVKEKPEVPLIGFAGAPFTIASYLIEGGSSRNFDRTKRLMYTEPELFAALMSRLVKVTVDYLTMQAQAGAHALMLFDSWVGCLSPQDFAAFVLPHVKEIVACLPKAVPTIYFGTATGGILNLMALSGASCIGVDWRVELDWAWQTIGHDRACQGNLDPISLLAPQEVIKANAARILEQAQNRPGHIFNLGHGIVKETPVDNVRYLVELVKELSSTRKELSTSVS
jgi:uroporphyrinogen decarboxylase